MPLTDTEQGNVRACYENSGKMRTGIQRKCVRLPLKKRAQRDFFGLLSTNNEKKNRQYFL